MSYVQSDPLQSKLDKLFPSILTESLPMFHSILSPNTVHSSSSLKGQFLCVFFSSITQLSCRSNWSFPITIWQKGITIIFYTIVFYTITITILYNWASLVAQRVKHLPVMQDTGFNPRVGKIPWRRKWQPTPILLLGKFHGLRSLVGYSPWGSQRVGHY